MLVLTKPAKLVEYKRGAEPLVSNNKLLKSFAKRIVLLHGNIFIIK